MHIAFFGSSLVSAYWNGAATYYRGILRALHEHGHSITFYEPDAYERQRHRDIANPDWARVVVYGAEDTGPVCAALDEAQKYADLVVKASGVGVFDELLEEAVASMRSPQRLVAFWDVDAPATLDRVQSAANDPFRRLIPQYDLVFTYGGGDPVVNAYLALGARVCHPVYNALDETTHFPVDPDPRFAADCGFLGNRLPDREARVEQFFLQPAAQLPEQQFVLGGSGWGDKFMPANVKYVGHVYTHDHNAFNCTAQTVLNINRSSMARYGFSPLAQARASSRTPSKASNSFSSRGKRSWSQPTAMRWLTTCAGWRRVRRAGSARRPVPVCSPSIHTVTGHSRWSASWMQN
jgi:spore maturation protein CgeB